MTGPFLLKDASVRMKCILALKALYEKRESAMKLSVFFQKFKVSEILCLGRCLQGRPGCATPKHCGACVDVGPATCWPWIARGISTQRLGLPSGNTHQALLWVPSPGWSCHASECIWRPGPRWQARAVQG